ncbi:uncharacterized protein [Argopecten irradians]|uniref:uncharacterized protein n=1 Tax=Argopecten irradians TaxID=31199 RepID=UPI003718B401
MEEFRKCQLSLEENHKITDSTLRAPDLLKKIRHHNEGKYDFKKIPLLKGTRNKNLKGRPHAIAEVSPRKRKADEDYAVSHEPLHQISAIQEIDVDLVPSLNIEECYLNGIKEQGGLFSIDNIFHSFILMDFSEETKTVKNNKFVFLKRKVNNFEDVGCWVYSCSCEPARAELIACLDNNLDVSFDDFVLRHPWCHHIQVVKTILEEFDAVNGIFPSTFERLKTNPFRPASGWTPRKGLNEDLDSFLNITQYHIETDQRPRPKHTNIPSAQRKALLNLKNNSEIVIKPADKGGAIVVQSWDDYILEANRQLNNLDHYLELQSDLTPSIIKEINGFLSKVRNQHQHQAPYRGILHCFLKTPQNLLV